MSELVDLNPTGDDDATQKLVDEARRCMAAKAEALEEAAKFRREHDLDHEFWNDLAAREYVAGDNMVSVWLDARAAEYRSGARG